ncbi:ABC transporter ATP-binding protein [Alkaliphilus transvaalensis]|uniref:ABC transporter ATP-binding protein n=1 Tax=Alkaliphilus transvaalensis TaxID=114628 RepID=UPI00047E33F6|nr:ABC transporter ATP-binding protein [Alkaliphilus transvaalensis]
MSIPILKVQGISKEYTVGKSKVKALKNIDFQLNKGEFIVIMGRSGSGKTTLLNILGGLDSPSDGRVYINGELIKNYHEEPYITQYRRDKIGFVFQAFNLLNALTVEENVALPLILKNEKAVVVKERTEEVLSFVGLYNRRNHRPVELSGGQQQRVAIARAIINSPAILLADEPTGNLDSKTAKNVLELIINSKEKFNQSIVLVTHDPKVAAYGDRILFFQDGAIVEEFDNLERKSIEENTCYILAKLQDLMEVAE